jgi:hypothetical protein
MQIKQNQKLKIKMQNDTTHFVGTPNSKVMQEIVFTF